MELNGKTFIVTDGDNELGKELVKILLAKNCNVIAVNCNNSTLPQTTNKDSLTVLSADITDEKSVESLYKQSLSIYGKVDGIINNAGITQSLKKISDLSFEAIERIFNINYFGILNLSRTFLPHFFSHTEANLVISSGASLFTSQKISYKSSSISSLKMLIEGLRSELLGTNVKVMLVSFENKDDLQTLSSTDAASAIINGIENGYSSVDINKNLMHDFQPDLFFQRMKKRIHKLFKQ